MYVCVCASREEEKKKRHDARGRRTNRIIFQHAQGAMRARADQGLVVARHGHGDETDGYGSGFRCCAPKGAAGSSQLR